MLSFRRNSKLETMHLKLENLTTSTQMEPEKQLSESFKTEIRQEKLELEEKNRRLREAIEKKSELEKQLEIETQNAARLKKTINSSEEITFEKKKLLEELNELK